MAKISLQTPSPDKRLNHRESVTELAADAQLSLPAAEVTANGTADPPLIVALDPATTRSVDIRTYDDRSTAAGDRADELNHQHSTTQRTASMMHPQVAKVLADARIDELLATAERHRLRQTGRRQRGRATEPTAFGTQPDPAHRSSTGATTSNVDPERSDQDHYVKS